MKQISVKIDDAITVDGKEINELNIRKPTVRDLKMSQTAGSELDRSLKLIGDLAGLAPDQVEQLSLTDLDKINQEMVEANFIPSAQTPPSR